jgi:hypothetical protein
MQNTPSRFQPRSSSKITTQSLLNDHEILSLTDKERDEIDFEAKTIIRQTMNRLEIMKSLEKGKT